MNEDSMMSIDQRAGRTVPVEDLCSDASLSPLEQWHLSVYKKSFHDYSYRDLGIALRQKVYPEFVVPIVIDRLEENPVVGFAYDGELLESLAYVEKRFWTVHPQLRLRLAAVINKLPPENNLKTEELMENM